MSVLDENTRKRLDWNLRVHCEELMAEVAQRWCSEQRGIPVADEPLAALGQHRQSEVGALLADWQKTDDGSYASIAAFVERVVLPLLGSPPLTAALDERYTGWPKEPTFCVVLATHDLIAQAHGQQAALAHLVDVATENTDTPLGGAGGEQYDDLLQKCIADLIDEGRLAEAAVLLEHRFSQLYGRFEHEPDPDRWYTLAKLHRQAGNRLGEGRALRHRLGEIRMRYRPSDEDYDAEADLRQIVATLGPEPSDALCGTLWELADLLLDDPECTPECIEIAGRAKAMDDVLTAASGQEYGQKPLGFTHRILDRWLRAHDGDWPGQPAAYEQLYRACGGEHLADAHLWCAERYEWKHRCALLDGRERHLDAARELFQQSGDERGLVNVAYEQAVLAGRVSVGFTADGKFDAHAHPKPARPSDEVILECRAWYVANDEPYRAAECLHVLADWDRHAKRSDDARVKYQQALDEYIAHGHGGSHSADLCRKHLSQPEDPPAQFRSRPIHRHRNV